MGESKRRQEQMTPQQRLAFALQNKLADEGLLIEAGWVGLRTVWVTPGASQEQIAEMRQAFFAGAQHLFTSMMGILDEGAEPTAQDLRRMDLIAAELDRFGEQLKGDIAVRAPAQGSA